MELQKVIEKRRTIREFDKKQVPISIIEYSIINALKAPTYNHLREWDFVIANNLETKLKLIESENLKETSDIEEIEKSFKGKDWIMKEMYQDAIPKQKRMILEAPSIIIVVFKPKTKVGDAKTIYDLNCLASVWASIENLLLSLTEHDVYGVTYIPQNINSIKEKMGIPAELEIASIIPIGYKAENAKVLNQKSISLSERIHYEKWQNR